MLRRAFSAFLLLVLPWVSAPVPLGAGGAAPVDRGRGQQKTGTLKGQAKDAKGEKLPAAKIRVRDAATGVVAADIAADAAGGFVAAGLAPATYVVEIVSMTGQVLGLSPAIAVAAGTTATVTVTATAIGAVAAAAAGGGFGILGLGTAATVGLVGAATAAAVVGVVTKNDPASPSR